MKIVTAAEMRTLDRRAILEQKIPSLQLMENAGSRVAEWLFAKFSGLERQRILILCGKGNNGGDGLVAARLLRQKGCAPQVFLFSLASEMSGDAAENLKKWEAQGGKSVFIQGPTEWKESRHALPEYELILDALLGTGLAGPVRGFLSTVISDVNRLCQRATLIAVDSPSGLPTATDGGAGEVLKVHYTITFTAPKIGQLGYPASDRVGRLIVRSIGVDPDLVEATSGSKQRWIEPRELALLPWRRKPNAHKGNFGHALIIAGSIGKSGAAALAAIGALRAGAGLVTVATSSEALPAIAATHPEIMTVPLIGTEAGTISARNLDYNRLPDLLKDKNVVAIGPGISTLEETQRFIHSAVAESTLPIILDADGLNAFIGQTHKWQQKKKTKMAITPHPGEMARLLGCTIANVQENRLRTAVDAAARWNVVVVLKGFHTVVATPDGRAFFNSTGNPGMATAGTGDVLTGVLTGLTAQFGTEKWESVLALGVYLHGLAGDLAAEEVGEAPMIASDVVLMLPQAYRQVYSEASGG